MKNRFSLSFLTIIVSIFFIAAFAFPFLTANAQRGCALAWGEVTGAYNVVRDRQHEHNIRVYVSPNYWFTMDVNAFAQRNNQNTPLEIVNVRWVLQGNLTHYEVDPNDPTKITVHTGDAGGGAVWAFVTARGRNGNLCEEEISSYIYIQMPY